MRPLPCANAPSAAKLFLQLCARSSTSATLDILLPRRTPIRAFSVNAAPNMNTSTRTPILISITRARAAASARRQIPFAGRKAFGTSRPLAKTVAIHNPQADEDGNHMILEITPRAADRLSQIMSKDKNPYLALRIQVESGGCHGFQYLMSLSTLPSTATSAAPPPEPEQSAAADITPSTTTANKPSPPILNEDDTIFAFAADEDAEFAPLTSPKIVLDLPSLELLRGSKVDYTMELIGSQFKIVDNPLATSSCGCGTSFDIKM